MTESLHQNPLELTEIARQSDSYRRLKGKFGANDTSKGLLPHDLTLGDIYDISLLYNLSHFGVEEPDTGALQQIAAALERMTHFPDFQWGAVHELMEKVRSSDRNDPIFQTALDLDKLMSFPGLSGGAFDISHNRVLITPYYQGEENGYGLALTGSNMDLDEYYAALFREVGLPTT